MGTTKKQKPTIIEQTVKFSDKNVGRKIKLNGVEHSVDWVSANKQKFRIKQGEGIPVIDFDLSDIEEVEGLVIDIT